MSSWKSGTVVSPQHPPHRHVVLPRRGLDPLDVRELAEQPVGQPPHRRPPKTLPEAEARARRLDEEAADKREGIREDFRLAMSARRAEAMRALAELRNVAIDEAERIIAEAKVHGARID